MKTAFITRSTLYTAPGGDTIQVLQTARSLRKLEIDVDVLLTSEEINYRKYDLLHFINIIRPADILYHLGKTKKPFVLSPVLVDYSEYDRSQRKGLSGMLLRQFSANRNEYIKTFARWVKGKDSLKSKSYIWKGQRKSIREILQKASILLPNSETEYRKLAELYGTATAYVVVPNGIDTALFSPDANTKKDEKFILCAARIEGIKNQLNLIKALNNSSYTLMLAGSPAPNQKGYFNACKKIAAKNIHFREYLPQETLLNYYKEAKVHALPSWFETCGLSSLEAAAMGCNIAITEKGYTREYFRNDAFYCDPGSPESIFNAIESASKHTGHAELQERILHDYTWQKAAAITAESYKKAIS